jgi:plasmid replication initiation protein
MAATPHEILTFIGRGTSVRDYHRLKAAFDRLQSTTVATSLHQAHKRRMHRFSWINEWTEHADAQGNAAGIDLIVPDWFYRAVLDDALVLTIDTAYFKLTGGLERWLYRLVRKHAANRKLAVRFPPSLHEVRESVAVQTLRLRAARHRAPSALAGLSPRRGTGDPRARAARFHKHFVIHKHLWTTCGSARAIGNHWARAIRNRNRHFSQLDQCLAARLT